MPAKTGHFTKVARRIPGTVTSMPKMRLAGDDGAVVDAGDGRADDGELRGVLELDRGEVRRRDAAAAVAIAPYPRERPLFSVEDVALRGGALGAGTFHCWAAATTSIERAAAPTWRMGSQLMGVAMLPPAH